jgi:acetyltransferase-like isoleucine patch superfamily enzyme
MNKTAKDEFKRKIINAIEIPENRFHPMVYIGGTPKIGKGTYIGLFSEINANKGKVVIGENCDIASFVAINCADSHLKTIGIEGEIIRSNITLENNVFVGSHSFIGGNNHIGHHSVIAAGTILINGGLIPPFSLIVGNPAVVKKAYYANK